MGLPLRPSSSALALAALGSGLVLWGVVPSGAAGTRGCASFSSQAAAQAYFMEQRGGAAKAVGHLDGDRDGVACEG